MQEPTPEKIAELKQKFPDRELQLIEAVDKTDKDADEEVRYRFIITGPNRDEYRKFTDDITRAGDTKPEEKLTNLRRAIENTALAMIRWPDRDTVKGIFDVRPGIVESFAEKIHAAAGGSVELRAKKL